MILKEGDLIQYGQGMASLVRVLWITETGASAVTIEVEAPKALPVFVPMEQLEGDLRSERAKLLLEDPYQRYVAAGALKARSKDIRDRAWRLIEPLVSDRPNIYVAHRRGLLVQSAQECAAAEGRAISHNTLYEYLRRYWQRGLTPNALLPDYTNCGGRGKERRSGKTKRGRPRQFGDDRGINVTLEIRKVFRVAVARCYASDKKRKWTLQDTYDQAIKDFFVARTYDVETGRVIHLSNQASVAAGGIPTFRQFAYWADKDNIRLEIKRKRLGARVYDKDFRGLLGTSNAQVTGPGCRYQIDATIADVYLVSRMNRAWIIGRPVIYVVIDVFSRMIVGLYIGLEGPSWAGAMMALANTADDKVAYCRRFGIDIEPEDWPCHFLPGALLADRGEIEGALVETLANNFNVIIENSAPYRADWKGVVEQRFRLLPAKFKRYVPGYIEPDFRERGGTDYRLDAVLDLDDFARIFIECVLHFNNHHEIDQYDRDRDVAADEVPAIPRELWGWGLRYRSGAMREYPIDLVKFSLMPTADAKVTPFGIRHCGGFYTCTKAVEERWFDRARQDTRWSVKISYDPRDMNHVYLHREGGKLAFDLCSLTDRSRAYRELSLWEAEQQQYRDKHRKANRRVEALLHGADADAEIQRHVEAAERKCPMANDESAASRTGAIRDNRAREKQANRSGEAFRPGAPASDADAPRAEIVPFPAPPVAAEEDFSLPSIDEILGEGEGEGHD